MCQKCLTIFSSGQNSTHLKEMRRSLELSPKFDIIFPLTLQNWLVLYFFLIGDDCYYCTKLFVP